MGSEGKRPGEFPGLLPKMNICAARPCRKRKEGLVSLSDRNQTARKMLVLVTFILVSFAFFGEVGSQSDAEAVFPCGTKRNFNCPQIGAAPTVPGANTWRQDGRLVLLNNSHLREIQDGILVLTVVVVSPITTIQCNDGPITTIRGDCSTRSTSQPTTTPPNTTPTTSTTQYEGTSEPPADGGTTIAAPPVISGGQGATMINSTIEPGSNDSLIKGSIIGGAFTMLVFLVLFTIVVIVGGYCWRKRREISYAVKHVQQDPEDTEKKANESTVTEGETSLDMTAISELNSTTTSQEEVQYEESSTGALRQRAQRHHANYRSDETKDEAPVEGCTHFSPQVFPPESMDMSIAGLPATQVAQEQPMIPANADAIINVDSPPPPTIYRQLSMEESLTEDSLENKPFVVSLDATAKPIPGAVYV